MRRRGQAGAALVEMQIVTLAAMVPMLLGIVQMALLAAAYHLLSYAAAEAARAGAVDHGREAAMVGGLAHGLLALHADLSRVTGGADDTAELASARLRSEAAVREFGRIERLSPSSADFADFARSRDGQVGIPNDSLEYRDATPGPRSGHSVQQANWLHIRVRYCHILVVPLIDRLLPPLLRRLDDDPDDQRCYAAGRIPLRTIGSSPMQSEAWR